MLYLEDYLELIEHLPQELRDRLTLIRENDLKVNNSSQQIDTKVKQFFAEAKKLTPEQRQCNYESILNDYEKTIKNADEKLLLADQTSEIMVKLIQKLDGELEKFKLELEADHAGITEQLERRSLELDAESRLDNTINGYSNSTISSRSSCHFKDRRRSFEHRLQPRHNLKNNNGYIVRAKSSQNHHIQDGVYSTSKHKQMPHHRRPMNGRYQHSNSSSRQNSTTTSPAPYGQLPLGEPSLIAGEHRMLNGFEMNDKDGHCNTNLTSSGNNPGFKTSYKNNSLPLDQNHSALSAALSSAVTPTTVHDNKISQNGTDKGSDYADGINNLVRQNPLAAAASQAIAETQQVRTRSQKRKLTSNFSSNQLLS